MEYKQFRRSQNLIDASAIDGDLRGPASVVPDKNVTSPIWLGVLPLIPLAWIIERRMHRAKMVEDLWPL